MYKKPKLLSSLLVIALAAITNFVLKPSIIFAQTTTAPAINSAADSTTSYNWAGYTASGSPITAVSGSWTVPNISASNTFSGDATWVGIGGITSNDLIQTGTQAINNKGSITYQAWYELLPDYSKPVSLTVSPGDSITASISQTGNNLWQISLFNNTTGKSYQTTVTYNSSLSSAEWIEEMPSQSNSAFIPLDNFNNIQFTGAYATKNGQNLNLSELNAQAMKMMSFNNQALANTSALASDGASFTVSRTTAEVSSTSTIPYGGSGWHRTGRSLRIFPLQTTTGSSRGISNRGFRALRQLMLLHFEQTNNFRMGR